MGGENDATPLLSKNNQAWNILKATKLGTFHWPLNKLFPHQQNIGFISKATKHGIFQGPPSLEPSIGYQVEVSLTSKALAIKCANWDHLIYFFRRDFQFEYLKTCSYNFP
jgi:hypothetical protein